MIDIYSSRPKDIILFGDIQAYKKELTLLLSDLEARTEFPEYIELLRSLNSNTINNDILDICTYSIMDICHYLEEKDYEETSEYIFPNHKLKLYPDIKTIRAKKIHLCAFSGARINIGSEHTRFKLLIHDITDRCSYVLKKPIRLEHGYEDKLPVTVKGLDDFEYRLNTAYENNNEEFYNISTNIGNDSLNFVKLKRKI
jgi:hypothetical protein